MNRAVCTASLIWVLLFLNAAGAAQDLCASCRCPVELSVQQPPNAPVGLGNFRFFAGGASYGMVNIVSRSEKAVAYYLIVLELFDENGEYLVSAPLFNSDVKGAIPFDVSFKSWLD